jgi:hypothetical protein
MALLLGQAHRPWPGGGSQQVTSSKILPILRMENKTIDGLRVIR